MGVEQGDVVEALKAQPGEAVGCLVAFDLIEHSTKNELMTLVDETYRVLKSGGRWIIHTPNAESPFGNRMLCWDFTRNSLAQVLLSSGFTKMSCFEDQPVPHGIKSVFHWVLWKCIRATLYTYLAVETGDLGRDAIFKSNPAWCGDQVRSLFH